jgi:tetratricopeptide (TPR) repeat protein
MMNRYRRLPALCALVAALSLGWAFFAARPEARATGAGSEYSLDELRALIVEGEAPAEIWYAYGQKLLQGKEFAQAALAYAQVLQRMPYHRPARFDRALALAQAGDRDAFFAFLREIVYSEPKLAVEVLGRREVASLAGDPRLEPLQREARSQAMD